ncbi:uncharacterized protein LOC143226051 isoform X1 [Tachypleus tridentatus]|uniref:uncharacterized protein LOC143226051 isoform X1 n=1 Tax=Tachypleus tridentatus TaxID=6853 RepID=UPI003FD19D9B
MTTVPTVLTTNSSNHQFKRLSSETDPDEINISSHSNTISDGGAFVTVEASHYSDFQSIEVSTSAVLHYCKRKILIPYFRLLALLGWRPLLSPGTPQDVNVCVKVFNTGYTITVLAFIVIGYILQYAACFRRDGFGPYMMERSVLPQLKVKSAHPASLFLYHYPLEFNNSYYNHLSFPIQPQPQQHCNGNAVGVYFLPDVLHLSSYIYVLYQMRVPEREQLEHLMERVFLQTTVTHAWHLSQRKLIRRLRAFLGMGLCWVLLSTSPQILHMMSDFEINFTWMNPHYNFLRILLIVLMLVTLLWNDIVCVAIATSYSVHCQLIISYLENISYAVREKTLSFQEFYKEIMEARKFINYLNEDQAVGVSLLILNYGCQTTIAIYGFVSDTSNATRDVFIFISVLNSVVLWIILLAFPVIQAARLTSSCRALRKLGHELRARPFGYQDTSQDDLDSVLLYTTSLKMQAKLFRMPVRGAPLILGLAVLSFVLLLLAQLNEIHLG